MNDKTIKNKKAIKTATNKITKYENDLIALTHTQVDDMYQNLRDAEKKLKKECTHEHCYIRVVTETDRGYGVDRDYYYNNVYCEDCESDLGNIGGRTGYSGSGPLTKTVPLIELIEANQKLFSDEWLKRHKIRRNEKVERTYSYSVGAY